MDLWEFEASLVYTEFQVNERQALFQKASKQASERAMEQITTHCILAENITFIYTIIFPIQTTLKTKVLSARFIL